MRKNTKILHPATCTLIAALGSRSAWRATPGSRGWTTRPRPRPGLLKLDADTNEVFSERYDIGGLPTTLFLDGRKKGFARKMSLMGPEDMLETLRRLSTSAGSEEVRGRAEEALTRLREEFPELASDLE